MKQLQTLLAIVVLCVFALSAQAKEDSRRPMRNPATAQLDKSDQRRPRSSPSQGQPVTLFILLKQLVFGK